MADIHGDITEQFACLKEVLSDSIEQGEDTGVSVAVTIDGEFVADIWGGWADVARTTPWECDTIVNVWSTTKTMTALSALTLVERGQLDVDRPVADYWPEFAVNGKEDVLVRHIMSHTSGVSGWDQPVVLEDLVDLEKSTAMLARQAPWFEPGSASGYHATNQGHLVGEVIRRVSGKTLGQFFADEIAGPLGADFRIGLPTEHHSRVSNVIAPPPIEFGLENMDPESPAVKTLTGPEVDAEFANTPAWRTAEVGAAGGHGNARSVARIQAIVANGGSLDSVDLLSSDTVDQIFRVQSDGIDLVLGIPLTWGIGYALPRPDTFPYLPQDSKICFWGGWGGSMIIIDLDRHMTIAYVMNQMSPGIIGCPTATEVITAVYDAM